MITSVGSRSLPSNTVANPKGKLKTITTRSGIVLDGPTVLSEYTIKVPPPSVQKYKPLSQREYVVHQRDPLHPNIPYSLRMLKQKQQEKDEVQIHKFWQMFKQLHINITLADALILIPKYHKCLNLSFQTRRNFKNCELKCKALADLGASINLMPLSVWKKLGLPELISTRTTLKLANRAICTPRVPLILGRPFLRTARDLIDVHSEEMILRDGDERLNLNMRHETSSYSNKPQKESINFINELADELALITFPPKYDDDIQFDVESNLKEIEFLLHQDLDSSLKDSINQSNLANPADNFVDSMPEMFVDEHAPDYSSPLIFDEYDDDFLKVESDTENVYDDPFDSKGEKSKSILSQEKPFEIITRVVQDKKLTISNASLGLEDFDPPFYEPLFFKEVPKSKMLLPFSPEIKEKVFKPGIHTSKKVHSSFIPVERTPISWLFLVSTFTPLISSSMG
nr:hypothetical protein [Tanacetum cinerariifolium]